MFFSRKNQSVASIAASGVLLDPQIRRAALDAAPALARLSLLVGRRTARRRAQQRVERVLPAIEHVASLAAAVVPQLLVELGVVEPPRRRRRLVPKATAVALAGAVAVYLLEPGRGPAHRRQLQRLVIH